MSKKSKLSNISKTPKNSPRMKYHILDYSISSFTYFYNRSNKAAQKRNFVPNRQNISLAITNIPLPKDFLSKILPKVDGFSPIFMETHPFFQNYIDTLQNDPKQKNLRKQNFSDELLNAFFQNAYDSIKASPKKLSYYEKVLCRTDAYSRFAASKVWEEELDYRCNLLKELLSKHSGQTQLEGLGNLLRTLDMYIAVYSKPPAQKEEPSVEGRFQEILDSLMDLRRDETSVKAATSFLFQLDFSAPDCKELDVKDMEPIEIRPQDEEYFTKKNGSYFVSLESIGYMEKHKKHFKRSIRHRAKEKAREVYLTARASAVESTPFWKAYQNMKHYLDASNLISGDADLNQIIETYLSRYYQDIWFRGTLSYNSRNIDSTSTVSEVALDGLAKEAVEYFVGNNTKDISYFGEVKNHIITFSYKYSNILSDGYLPCIPRKAYKESLLFDLDQLVKKITEYIGEAFGRDFSEQCPDLSQKQEENICHAWSSILVALFSSAISALNIPDNKAITATAVVQDLGYVIALIHNPDFVYPLWRQSGINQGFFHTPILDYITFVLKMYYDFLDASKEVAEVFRQYCSYMEEKRTEDKQKQEK